MNVIKVALLTTGLGLALGISAPANAVLGHWVSSNAVDKCQSFTPGVTNTIRNRVIGSENVGSAPLAVACVFELDEVSGGGTVDTTTVFVSFSNGTGAAGSVTCTLLPGSVYNGSVGTAVTSSTASIAPGATGNLSFTGTTYSVFSIGVNCTLPPGFTLIHTRISYTNDET